LIGALVPAAVRRPRPRPAVLPALPAVHPLANTGEDDVLLEVARLDRSGRISARGLLGALGWRPGHRVGMDTVGGAVVVASSVTGRHVVGSRGELALPVSVRRMCGMVAGLPVVVAAVLGSGLLLVHPAGTVARLVREYHGRLAGVDDGR
jgi:hypothetical protein